jgi:glucosamine kinase
LEYNIVKGTVMNNNMILYAGIDGGGSKCSAMLFNHKGEVVAQGIAGAANAARDLQKTLNSMIESVTLALKEAKLDAEYMSQIQVGAGLAGACVPDVNAQLLAWQHPFARFKVSSDLSTSCYGAHGGNDGALLIVGTGSSAARMQKGKLTQFGGHGFMLGDKGSGAWFGRSAVASTLEALDGLIPFSSLHDTIMTTLAVDSSTALLQKMLSANPSQFAALAPDVVQLAQQDDSDAISLVKEGVTYLDNLCQRTLQDTDLSLVLMGGLAPSLIPWFSPAVRERIVTAKAGPEWGAMRLVQADLQLAC